MSIQEQYRRLLRLKQVQERVPLSRVQIWRRVRAGTFPAPVQIGPNSVGWYEDEIDAISAAMPRVSYAPTIPHEAA
jgi:prophage regulatory protein